MALSPERYERVTILASEALDKQPSDRRAFLLDACDGDAALLADVESFVREAEDSLGALASDALGQALEQHAVEVTAEVALPERVGPYRVEERLGQGGMGVVYQARDESLQRPVALKTLSLQRLGGPDAVRRLEEEARLLASVSHEGLAVVYGLERVDDLPVLAMELVEGETLAESLAKDRPPTRRAIEIVALTAGAVAAAHARDVVHRDLKPANLMVTADGKVKVLDFGLAVRSTAPLARPGAVVGTPRYMSPEQIRGEAADERADVWALGCLLFECLTGRPAFDGTTFVQAAAAVFSHEPDLASLPEDTPATVRQLLKDCLQKEVGQRPASAADVARILESSGSPERSEPDADLLERSRLPREMTSFVGRETELARLRQLLATEPVVTLTGPAGSGKTRLALRASAEAGKPAFFIRLAGLSDSADPRLIAQEIASALSVRTAPGQDVRQALLEQVRDRRLLLVLDNCEHVRPAVADLVSALVQACRELVVLATSREPLRVAGETVEAVPPLAVPADDDATSLARLTSFESARLFIERARQARPGFDPSRESAQDIASLCQRLQGMPLALELAAARVRTLSVEQLVTRLGESLDALGSSPAASEPRHASLRAAIDWSHALLDEAERALYRRLSVFAGGWSLESAESLHELTDLHADGVEELLASLVEKSLVTVRHEGDAPRFDMLASVREHAREQLEGAGELDRMSLAHGSAVITLLERTKDVEFVGAERQRGIELFDAEHDNVQAALNWLHEAGEDDRALRLCALSARYFYARDQWREASDWLDKTLGRPTSPALEPTRAAACLTAGTLAFKRADWKLAGRHFLEALRTGRRTGKERTEARALNHLSVVTLYRGKVRSAETLSRASLVKLRQCGTQREIAEALQHLGELCLVRGDLDGAVLALEEALQVAEAADATIAATVAHYSLARVAEDRGDLPAMSHHARQASRLAEAEGDLALLSFTRLTLVGVLLEEGETDRAFELAKESLRGCRDLGMVDRAIEAQELLGAAHEARGEMSEARAHYETGLAEARRTADPSSTPLLLEPLGRLERQAGNLERAAELFREAVSLTASAGHRVKALRLLDGLAEVLAAGGRPTMAVRIFGHAHHARTVASAQPMPKRAEELQRVLGELRELLGEEAFETEWAAGAALDRESALALALETTDESSG